jgi:hypothetical protein
MGPLEITSMLVYEDSRNSSRKLRVLARFKFPLYPIVVSTADLSNVLNERLRKN